MLFWYWYYYPHTPIYSVSPVCGIFRCLSNLRDVMIYSSSPLTIPSFPQNPQLSFWIKKIIIWKTESQKCFAMIIDHSCTRHTWETTLGTSALRGHGWLEMILWHLSIGIWFNTLLQEKVNTSELIWTSDMSSLLFEKSWGFDILSKKIIRSRCKLYNNSLW